LPQDKDELFILLLLQGFYQTGADKNLGRLGWDDFRDVNRRLHG
jgi:hypothetical protein